jgi:hypothetical protein
LVTATAYLATNDEPKEPFMLKSALVALTLSTLAAFSTSAAFAADITVEQARGMAIGFAKSDAQGQYGGEEPIETSTRVLQDVAAERLFFQMFRLASNPENHLVELDNTRLLPLGDNTVGMLLWGVETGLYYIATIDHVDCSLTTNYLAVKKDGTSVVYLFNTHEG